MQTNYVEERDKGFWVAGTRVSLDSVVYEFLKGRSPESIAQAFPVLTLEQVYGAIAFYLGRRAEIDAHLRQEAKQFERMRRQSRKEHPLLYEKLEAARSQIRDAS